MKKLLIASIALLSLSGCLQTREELRDSQQDQTSAMQKAAKNDVDNRFSDLEASMRDLNNRVDVTEHQGQKFDQSQEHWRKNIEDQLAETNKKVQLLQDEIVKYEGQMQMMNEQLAAAAAKKEEASKAEEKSAKGKESKSTAFDEGESLFGKKEWGKAILSYQKYRDQSPKGKQFPEATYKMGVCFQELGKKDDARTFYEEVVAKFPGSGEAKRAKIRLKKL